jgi:CRP-like cAMP-binding protein
MESHEGDPTKRGSSDDGRVLAECNLLDALSVDDRLRLFSVGRGRIVEAGEEVVRQGTCGDCLFVLTEGELAVVRCLPGDEEKVLSTARPEMVLGEVAALGRGVRSATLRATRRSVLREIGLRAFEAVTLYGDDGGHRILRAVAVSVHKRLTRTRRTAITCEVPSTALLPVSSELRWSIPDPEVVSILGLLSAFEGMDARDWKEMLPFISVAYVERGASFVLPEALGSHEVVIVLRGALSPWVDDTGGPEVTMPTTGPGGFVEYAGVLGITSEPHRWRARSPTQLLRLDPSLFAPGSAFAPCLLYALSRNLATTLRRSAALSVHFRMAWTHARAAGPLGLH